MGTILKECGQDVKARLSIPSGSGPSSGRRAERHRAPQDAFNRVKTGTFRLIFQDQYVNFKSS
jgi:hypothetical protein